MNAERGHEELAAQNSRCWRLVTAPPGVDAERLEHLQWAHYIDPNDAIETAQELVGGLAGWDELLTFTATVRAGLTQQREPCWVVRCRDCGTPLGDEEDAVGVLPFQDPTSAYEAAERQCWIVDLRGGTRLVCPRCQQRQQPGSHPGADGSERTERLGDLFEPADRVPGPGQLVFADPGSEPDTTVLDELAASLASSPAEVDPRARAERGAGAATADPPEPAAAAHGEVPDEFRISPCLWPQVAVALVRGGDPGPRPAVFSPDRVEALARTAPDTALRAVRVAVGWVRAPHNQRDLALCLAQWRVEPRGGHFVKAEHAAVGRGRARVAVGTCGDCGYPVTRRGGPTARWVPIWPPVGRP